MKKLFAVALALVLSVGIFAGCNASGTSSSAPVSTSAPAASSSASPSDDPTQMTAEITWWAFPTFGQENADDPAGTYEQKIIEAFNEKYPDKGYLIVVDEFLSYLTSRSNREIVLDLDKNTEVASLTAKADVAR